MKRFILFFIFVLIFSTGLFAQKDCNVPATFIANYDIEVTPATTWSTDSQTIASLECTVYKVNMTFGEDYIFKTGCDDGATADFDTIIDVYDSTATLIISGDDNCEAYRSKVEWTATETVAYVKVRGYNSTNFGDFTLAYWSSWTSPIYIPDDNFRAVINAALGQPIGYNPTIADLESLTETISGSNHDIVSIEGAQHLINVTDLHLGANEIIDISPLADLTNLEVLFLGANQIVDISPLADLVNLTQLYLDANQINDISALAGLTNLHRVWLYNNLFSDIYPLVENTGFGFDDKLKLEYNGLSAPLSVEALTDHIPILISRGFETLTYPALPNDDAACYPIPVRNAVDVSLNTLQWQGNFGAAGTSYEVYLGTNANALNFIGSGSTANGVDHTLDVSVNDNTEYWWRVYSSTGGQEIWSGLWHFTTGINLILDADFEANNTNVYTGSNVQFTDLSNGVPISWAWDFDGDLVADSFEQNPTFAYNAPGVYSVSLVVFDGGTNDLETKTNYITVTDFAALEPVGTGTTINPFQIENLGNLLWVSENSTSWDKHFIQTADIDASSTINWNSGTGFSPIGNYQQYNLAFTGSYDGQDHVINGLYINRISALNGLFGIIESGSAVANLGLTNVNISGSSDCGGLAGVVFDSEISNCYTTGSVTASDVSAGGLTGGVYTYSLISNCYSSATVFSDNGVGGLASVVCNNSTIEKCYATGNVSGVNSVGGLTGGNIQSYIVESYAAGNVIGEFSIGGLTGYSDAGTIIYCYSTGAVVGSSWVGGLIGTGTSSVDYSYWDIETSGQTASAGGEGKTTAEMMLPSTYVNWDFTNIWFMENGINNGYPFLEDIEHFVPCWSGNGYQNMQIFINIAEIKGVPVVIGDEIGLFDGDLCVGGGTITGFNPPFVMELVAAADDPLTPEIDGFIDGHPINYQIWDNDASILYTNVVADYVSGDGLFSTNGYALANLQADDSIIYYSYLSGWNLGSFNVIPFNYDMLMIMEPLITNGSLIQAQDESGNNLCNLPTIGWYNSIGDMMHTEGYYINMNQDDDLPVIYNHQVLLPLDIPFTQGWNIMGFPFTGTLNAQEVVQPLISSGNLVKVIAESGDALWYDNTTGTWNNDIGDMSGGKGYFIKVSADCTLTLNYPADAIANNQKTKQTNEPANRETFHFQSVWQNNPFLPMNFFVSSLQIAGINLEPTDELSVFDGELCVGTAQVGENDIIPLIAATDDVITEDIVDGFINGNDFSFKFWDSSTDTEYNNFQLTINSGDEVFISQGTTQASIEFLPTGNGGDLLPTVTKINQNYPNPFNPETNIAFSLKETGQVTIEIFNMKGQKVKTLTNREYEAGYHNLTWQSRNEKGAQVGSGVYFYRFSVDGKTKDMKKMLLLK